MKKCGKRTKITKKNAQRIFTILLNLPSEKGEKVKMERGKVKI